LKKIKWGIEYSLYKNCC